MKTETFPKSSFLFFSSVYSQESSKYIFYARLITQIFTKSNYEHVAICHQCPKSFDGQIVTDNRGSTLLKAGEYYVFEANKDDGIVVRKLPFRLAELYSNEKKWSGKVFVQSFAAQIESNDDAFKDCVNMLGWKYPHLTWVIFSAFDKTKPVQWLLKKLNIKPRLHEQHFCSSFAFINYQVFNDQKIDKERAIGTTPEELRKYVYNTAKQIEHNLIEVENGKLFSINKKYLSIK